MNLYELVQKTLWFIPIPVEFAMVIVLFKRQIHRELPFFTTYLTCVCGRDLIMSVFFAPFSVAYFYTYWWTELVLVALGFAVLYEVFGSVIRPYESIHRMGNRLFCCVAVVLVIVALVAASTASRGHSQPLVAAILAVELVVRIVQTGLALFLFVFASSLGLSWRHFSFGVAMGFGLYAASELVAVAMRSHFGEAENSAFVLLKPAAFTCSVLMWSSYIFRKEPVVLHQAGVPDHYNIAAWNHALSEYLHQ